MGHREDNKLRFARFGRELFINRKLFSEWISSRCMMESLHERGLNKPCHGNEPYSGG